MVDVFIDESGIFRNIGYTVYCITFVDSKNSQELDSQIQKIEQQFKIPPFHWRDHIWSIKTKFLEKIINLENWNCILLVIGNQSYSNKMFEQLLSKALQGLYIKSMFIDGKKHKTYIYEIKRSLKRLSIKVGTLKLVKDQAKGGLRISDAVAGLSRLHFDKKFKKDAEILFNRFLKQKITTQILSGY